MEETNAPCPDPSRYAMFSRRPVCEAAAGFLMGVAGAGALCGRAAFVGAGISLLMAAVARRFKQDALVILLLFMALGRVRLEAARLPAIQEGAYWVEGVVCQRPEERYGSLRLVLADCTLNGTPVRGRVRIWTKLSFTPEAGTRIRIGCRLTPPAGKESYDRYLRILADGTGDGDSYQALSFRDTLTARFARLQGRAVARVEALFADNAGVAAAMLLGERSKVEQDTRQQLSGAGVAHLIAVSGLHVGILAGLLVWIVRIPNAWARMALTALLLGGYVLLIGAAPSAMRAGLMFSTAYLAKPLGQRPDPAGALAAALLVIVWINPYAVGYAGFQLSFLAVLGLTLLEPILGAPLARLGRKAAGLIGGTVAVTVSTLPAVAAFFGEVPLAGLMCNLLVLPLMPVFMGSAAAALLLSLLSLPAGLALAAVPNFVLNVILYIADYAGSFALRLPAPGGIGQMLYLMAMVFASPYVRRPWQTRAMLALLCLAGAMLAWRL